MLKVSISENIFELGIPNNITRQIIVILHFNILFPTNLSLNFFFKLSVQCT